MGDDESDSSTTWDFGAEETHFSFLLVLMDLANANGADLAEIRLDCLKPFLEGFNVRESIQTLVKITPLPTLFTYRPTWEGGQYDGNEHSRLAALRLAMELGADHIDVELKAVDYFNNLIHGDKPTKCKVIVSSHNYQNTPSIEELGNLLAKMQSTGANIVKFVTTAVDITDVARVFHITGLLLILKHGRCSSCRLPLWFLWW